MFGEKLNEGKTKIIYAHPDRPDLAYMLHKDDISAFDGVRQHVLEGKGVLSCQTTSNVFKLLQKAGITTHFIDKLDDTTMLVRKCNMVLVEVVIRRIAAGSYPKRYPEVSEGTYFNPLCVEFFLKDGALHDPFITIEELQSKGLVSFFRAGVMKRDGCFVFEVLEKAWEKQRVTLVDLKIEFGWSTEGQFMVADVIDNDSWRIWPDGQKEQMLDKQVYRDMDLKQIDLDLILKNYKHVADMTESF